MSAITASKAATTPKSTTAPKTTTVSEKTDIATERIIRNGMFAYGGWLYETESDYNDGSKPSSIVRTRIENGAEIREVILTGGVADKTYKLSVSGDLLYFYTIDNNRSEIYCIGTDGTNLKKIRDVHGFFTVMRVFDNYIYYTVFDAADECDDYDVSQLGLFRIPVDGTGEPQKITGSGYFQGHNGGYESDVTEVAVDGEWVYFSKYFRGIYRIRVDGTELELIFDKYEMVTGLHIVGEQFIFAGRFYDEEGKILHEKDGGIFLLNKDGTAKTVLAEVDYPWFGGRGAFYDIAIDDGWIYCYNFPEHKREGCRRMRLDGSENALIFVTP